MWQTLWQKHKDISTVTRVNRKTFNISLSYLDISVRYLDISVNYWNKLAFWDGAWDRNTNTSVPSPESGSIPIVTKPIYRFGHQHKTKSRTVVTRQQHSTWLEGFLPSSSYITGLQQHPPHISLQVDSGLNHNSNNLRRYSDLKNQVTKTDLITKSSWIVFLMQCFMSPTPPSTKNTHSLNMNKERQDVITVIQFSTQTRQTCSSHRSHPSQIPVVAAHASSPQHLLHHSACWFQPSRPIHSHKV